MYLEYFGLEKNPFTISPDPSFLYPSPQHRQALAHLKYGLEREGGFVLLTGEVGTGKTTLTRLLLKQLPGNIRVAYILNAQLGARDLMSSICQELGIQADDRGPGAGTSFKEYADLLNTNLLAAHAEGKKTLVVIEEAQNLDPKVLEMLRLLTNLETDTTKLLHILLVAQPELLDVIGRPELRQLNQRIISRSHLQPLSLGETTNYLRHRMRRAGCQRPVFEASSVKEIYKVSNGIPRLINLLSERSLMGAYASTEASVTARVVKTAAIEVLGARRSSDSPGFAASLAGGLSRQRVTVISLCAVLLLGGLLYAAYQTSFKDSDRDLATEVPSGVVSEEERSAIDESIVVPEQIALDQVASTSPTLSNAYTQLLESWSINSVVSNRTEFCATANRSGLKCESLLDLEMDGLLSIERPGIIRLSESDDQTSLHFLSAIQGNTARLSNANGRQDVSVEELLVRWDGYYLYLWQAPPGYTSSLSLGMKNSSVLDWLQSRLFAWNPSFEQLISGGVYSEAIRDRVRDFQLAENLEPDGVLGKATIVRLNILAGDGPALAQR